MYSVLQYKSNNNSLNEATGIPTVKLYHCEKKKMAVAYLRKKFESRCKTINNKCSAKTAEIMDCGSSNDGTWANIEYIDKELGSEPGYKYTREGFMVVRSQKIPDILDNLKTRSGK